MTSTQSLLYAAASEVTIERVRTLVKQVGPEATTLEYKEQMSDTIAKGVAALANTYGGLLIVGVTDSRVVKGVKEKTIEAVAEHCAAKIEPPWAPEIIPVPLGQGSDLYALVLRIVPGHYPRPLLVDGVAYVRHQNTDHPADWQRLRDLFSEVGPGQQDLEWNIRRPDLPHRADGLQDEAVDFVLRSGLVQPVAREARWRPLSERSVVAFTEALNKSVLSRVLPKLGLGDAPSGGLNPFHRHGFNRARTVQLEWDCIPDGWPADTPRPVEATARLEMPGGYGDANPYLQITLDVVARRSLGVELMWEGLPDRLKAEWPKHWQVSPQQLGELIDALLATLSSTDVLGPLADLAGINAIAFTQPRVLHLVTARPMPQVLESSALRLIPDAGVSMGAHLLADPARDLAADDERHDQVRDWLVQIALDSGMVGMEQIVEHLDFGRPGTC